MPGGPPQGGRPNRGALPPFVAVLRHPLRSIPGTPGEQVRGWHPHSPLRGDTPGSGCSHKGEGVEHLGAGPPPPGGGTPPASGGGGRYPPPVLRHNLEGPVLRARNCRRLRRAAGAAPTHCCPAGRRSSSGDQRATTSRSRASGCVNAARRRRRRMTAGTPAPMAVLRRGPPGRGTPRRWRYSAEPW